MTNDFEIKGVKFKLHKIDAFKQFHIVRRLGPLLGDIIPVAQKLGKLDQEKITDQEKFDSFAQMISPIMNGLSKLSDADANVILLGLCSSVEMYQETSGNWGRVATSEILCFQNLSLPTLLQIAGKAFTFNLTDFFAIAPKVSHGQA